MTKEEFRDAGMTLFGTWGWRTRMAKWLQVDVSSVRRWADGQIAVPGPVEAAINAWLRLSAARWRQTNSDTFIG